MNDKYRVQAHRSGDWWALEFDTDDRIQSQARRLDLAPAMAADALSLWFDRHIDATEIDVVPVLDGELGVIAAAAEARHIAEQAQATAQTATRAAALAGHRAGLSVRDIGELLGVTHAYAARLARSSG